MLLSYPQDQHSRGGAWRDLLDHIPEYECDGHRFKPRQHHFRKDHEYDVAWQWYVKKWCYLGAQILIAPCEPPEPITIAGSWTYAYIWSVWTERDGTPCCGFVLNETWAAEIKEATPSKL